MANAQQEKIARMDWDDFEKKLQSPTRGSARGDTSEEAMRQYFGDEEFEYLRNLADHAQSMRTRAGTLGNLILLPGIMGTNLESVERDGDRDLIWVNILRMAWGQVGRLKLTADGKRDADSGFKIAPSVIDKRTYARAVVYLGARWRVLPFPFDWRKDIDVAADALADFIKANSNGQPVHLVAHSMGGLVCRNFIRRHKDVWEKINDAEGTRGGKLVMLGTPNYGSFAIPQAMKGTEKLVRWLEKADVKHDMNWLLAVLNTFVGTYQMLPAPEKISETAQVIYRAENWKEPSVSADHLKRAIEFHAQLDEETVTPERMIYIAGCNRETLTGLRMVSPGEFDYTSDFNGDGRVPFALGILPGVRTYYVDEAHGDLPRNELVLTAVDEILSTGRTNTLATNPPALRSIKPGAVRARHTVADQQLGNEVERIAREVREKSATPEEERVAEELIMQATLGQDQKTEHAAVLENRRKKRERKKARRKLQIRVVLGDISRVGAPIIVCGHYKGVAPKRAEASLDKALHYWISRANEHGMIGADLGQLFFIPVSKREIAARAVLLAGMGEEGTFGRDDLRYLMLNVTYALSALDVESYATVLMGSSRNNMSIERALRSLLFGVCDALSRLPPKTKLKTLLLVEKDKSRHSDIVNALKKIKDDESAAQLEITVRSEKPKSAMPRSGGPERPDDLMPEDVQRPGVRITVERDQTVEGGTVKDVFRLSAMTDTAVIPVRESIVQTFFVEGIADHLMGARTIKEQEMFGKLLYSYLIPEDFGRIIDNDTPLTLVLDRSTASFPWEMACFGGINGNVFFGPSLQLARQFRTRLSSSPGIAPPLNRRLRVLVIADPAPEPEYQLAGARLEGREVVKVFQRFKRESGLDIEIVDHIGADECDPVELLGLILNEEFDVIHFAGHGYFDEKDPNLGGWVFGKDCFLTPMEIFKARRVPRLVFANACYSAVVREGKPLSADEMNQHLAG
ncbi:MAG TPA: CHAT domain-containing protein, partial [Pyrinomonadaceae bacterium]|nr:CHAT domain-containing protein [Pyrinomonadaceae bacterium]